MFLVGKSGRMLSHHIIGNKLVHQDVINTTSLESITTTTQKSKEKPKLNNH